MSVLLSWICLNSYAQLPHPNDTLDNGKKVPFNQFLGRFSVFNEGGGAAFYYSLNIGYSVIKTDLVVADVTLGANRIPHGQYEWREESKDTYHIPIGLSLYLGRRKSRFNARAGYSPIVSSKLFRKSESSNDEWPPAIKHTFFFSFGYTYQNPYGFFLGINAYFNLNLNTPSEQEYFGRKIGYQPWPGLVLGYRLPSKQRHNEWTERSFKKRVLRLEESPKKRKDTEEDWFNDKGELQVDSIELQEIEARMIKLHKRHLRYQLQEKRENGRSLIFAEGFGASGIWSLNYSYTHPIAKSNIFMMEYRGGIGSDESNLQLPIHLGVKAMKNYRGTGVFLGVEPQYDWERGKVGAVFFLEHNVEFHFSYGLTGGVAFYLFYDPAQYKFYDKVAPYGGVFLGYRLPKMKKA